MAIVENRCAEYFVYKGLKNNRKILFMIGIALNKIGNMRLLNKKNEIFAAHGSFVILKKKVVEKINPLYDEKFFLFAEEGVLAYRSRECGFHTVYNEKIVVNHKEDGCMNLADFSINDELKKSNIYFYEKYILKNKNYWEDKRR